MLFDQWDMERSGIMLVHGTNGLLERIFPWRNETLDSREMNPSSFAVQPSVVKLVNVLLSLSKQPTVQHSPLITMLTIREIDRVNRPRVFHKVENLAGGSHTSEFERHRRPARTECSKKVSNSSGQFAFLNRRTRTNQNRHDLCFELLANFFQSLHEQTSTREKV